MRKALRQAFAAFSYEHCGEMLSTSKKYQILSDDITKDTVKDNNKEQPKNIPKNIPLSKRILLAFEKDIEDELIKYSIDAAKYFNAKIDILTSLSKDEIKIIMNEELARQSVLWSYTRLEAELLAGISDYTSSHSNILFMVTSQPQLLTDQDINKKACTLKMCVNA